MRISDVIQRLTEIKDEHGDLPVTVFDPDQMHEGTFEPVDAFISIGYDDKNEVDAVSFVDEETALSLDNSDDTDDENED